MAPATPVFTRETFRFFRDLGRNNRTAWMSENRERYKFCVVQPFRRLLEELTPAVLDLDSRFDISGRTGTNFSRINRDIRFAKDKTPYRTQMYLTFSIPVAGDEESGQLYAGVSTAAVTAGFRIYTSGKRKDSILARIGEARVHADPKWPGKQKKRLGRGYESYWYAKEKSEWTKRPGWPTAVDEWEKILGWVVRCKTSPAGATRSSFPRDVMKIFRDLYPLLRFSTLPD